MNNVILIGMPGCGKSTVGVLLAKNLGYSFIDSDLLIQQKEGRKLQDILNTDGIEYFGRLENEVNGSLDLIQTVVATGGSAVYWPESMAHLKSLGTVVYLKVPFEEIEKRIQNFESRGIVVPEGKTFYDVFLERSALYEKYADIVIEERPGEEIWANCLRITDAIIESENE